MHEAHVLRDALDRELAAYQALLALGEKLQTALVARDTETIHDIAKRQTSLLAQAERLGPESQEALTRLVARLGVDSEGATVLSAAERLESSDAEMAVELRSRRNQIADCVDRLANTNWVNAQLLDSAMDAIRFTFQLFAGGASEPEVGYPAAEGARRVASVLLDQHA